MIDNRNYNLLFKKERKIYFVYSLKKDMKYFCSKSLFIIQIKFKFNLENKLGFMRFDFHTNFTITNDLKRLQLIICKFYQLNGFHFKIFQNI